MTLRPILLPTLCAVAALAGACDDSVRISSTHSETSGKGVLKVVEALQCPQTVGSLTRKGSAQSEGRVCTYVGPRGAEVSLHLAPLDGGEPAEILKAFESRLSTALPEAVARLKASAAQADADQARAETEAASAETEGRQAAADADSASVRAPGVAVDANGEDASVRLPGVSIDAKGEKASVRIGGFHIDANDRDGSARVTTSGEGGESVVVNARDDTAEVRTRAGGGATRASWILTDNRASASGWKLVAYEARGPVGGPLVVATVRSRDNDRDRALEDARELVTLNVGE
ncbi:MAG TPA: methyltransferase type 11 [Brevundimonas sp.]|nr:methyltransferase type 11 [Brevundimonas sp.]